MTNLSEASRSLDLISAEESLLLIIDMQERFLRRIASFPDVRDHCVRLLQTAKLFDVPTTLTVQNPAGLGEIVPEILEVAPESGIPEKFRFSAALATGWPMAAERSDSRRQVVIAGIETHICVLQTVLDLISWGYQVFVVADAAGSQKMVDHDTALQRLRDAGAVLTTAQSVQFEWCVEAGTDRFREMRNYL